jgi:hypothetical protein
MGIQSSILMSESEVGLASAMTRQNAGRLLYTVDMSIPLKGAGGPTNVPAGIVCASVIFVADTDRLASFSHESSARAKLEKNARDDRSRAGVTSLVFIAILDISEVFPLQGTQGNLMPTDYGAPAFPMNAA